MKVFFTATYTGKDEFADLYKAIYDEIAHLGYDHVNDEVITTTYNAFTEKMSVGRKAQLENFHQKMGNIQSADICIVETSIHSFGSGFIVQKSLEMAKPTIVLYYKNNIPFFLNGVDDDKLVVKSYDKDNYHKVLRDAFNVAREKRDKRFNFFLSPKLLNYIEDASKGRGITKSKLLRDMIVLHMRENKESAEE